MNPSENEKKTAGLCDVDQVKQTSNPVKPGDEKCYRGLYVHVHQEGVIYVLNDDRTVIHEAGAVEPAQTWIDAFWEAECAGSQDMAPDVPTGMGLYAVSGRIPGDDDDSVEILTAASVAEAHAIFKAMMLEDKSAEQLKGLQLFHGTTCFVISTTRIGTYVDVSMLSLDPDYQLGLPNT